MKELTGAKGEALLDRRSFVSTTTSALIGAVLGGCASLVTRPVNVDGGKVRLPLRNYPELTEPGGSLKILPAGAAEPVYVLALADGTYSALSPICTHLGCTVDVERTRLLCPCHGSTFDRSGKVLVGPAEIPLPRYATEVSPDAVLVIDLTRRL